MPSWRLILLTVAVAGAFLAATALVLAGPSLQPRFVAGYTCDDVRAKVATYGERAAELWARLRGLSSADIARIRKTCGV